MLKKHASLLGIIIALSLLVISTTHYPGGNQQDSKAIGYSWLHNYVSNLFGEKAVNGADNPARPWAVAGMLFFSASFALFFIQYSSRIPKKSSATIIKYFGVGAMVCVFLAVTPLHDLMVTISSTLILVGIFYITVFVFMSKLHLFKILCVVFMLLLYTCMFIYYTRVYLEILPVMQKLVLVTAITWMLALHYYTTAADFKQKEKKAKVSV